MFFYFILGVKLNLFISKMFKTVILTLSCLSFPLVVFAQKTPLDEVLQLIEHSEHIDLDTLGPELEKKLSTEMPLQERSELLLTLINAYFTDGLQDKFLELAQQLKAHGEQYNLPEELFIANLFLLPGEMNVSFRSQAFFKKLQDIKNNLNGQYSQDVLYQIDIMLTLLTPGSFEFSQEQALMNHLQNMAELNIESSFKLFFYKALSTSHSQIDLMTRYSKKLLEYGQKYNLPVNRNAMLHNLGYSYHFRRMTKESRKCIDLQLIIAKKRGNPQEVFFAQAREMEQLDQEQNYPAMINLARQIKSSKYKPSEFWQNFIDYYEAIAQAYTGQVEAADTTFKRINGFLNQPDLASYALPTYLNAHILFNQQEFEASKQAFNDYWWHRY